MTKRPLCIAALVWAALLWLLGAAGVPFLGFSPPQLSQEAQGKLVLVSGIVYRADSYPQSNYLYLKKTNLGPRTQLAGGSGNLSEKLLLWS